MKNLIALEKDLRKLEHREAILKSMLDLCKQEEAFAAMMEEEEDEVWEALRIYYYIRDHKFRGQYLYDIVRQEMTEERINNGCI